MTTLHIVITHYNEGSSIRTCSRDTTPEAVITRGCYLTLHYEVISSLYETVIIVFDITGI